MFTGFASENTPAIQVWDFFRDYTGQAVISLTDDCAPLQYFRTGSNGTAINLYLPTAPIEGKPITIINQRYGSSDQKISIRSADLRGTGTNNEVFSLGVGGNIVLVYSKQAISFGTVAGFYASGWIALNQTTYTTPASVGSIALGNGNSASGSTSVVIGGSNNSANALGASVFGGGSNAATGSYASVLGGGSNSANGGSSAVIGGGSHLTTGASSIVLGGDGSTANSTRSAVLAGNQGRTRSIVANTVLPASDIPVANSAGVSQLAILVLGRQTTDATATVLTSNTSSAATTNQVILPNNSAYTFQGTVIAAKTAAGDTSSWKFEGAIKRGANAASTALVAAVTPLVIAQDAGAVTWVVAVTADTTNGGIAVTVTGAAATTIRWVCKIETTEVTF